MLREDAKIIFDIGISEQGKLDKVILLVSSGTLVLSMNLLFLQKIHFENLYLLFIAWFFFVISIISHMSGYFFSVKKVEVQLHEISTNKPSSKKYSKHIDYLNAISFIAVTLGIVVIIFFAGLNLNKLNMERDNTKAKESKEVNIDIPISLEPGTTSQPDGEQGSQQGSVESGSQPEAQAKDEK